MKIKLLLPLIMLIMLSFSVIAIDLGSHFNLIFSTGTVGINRTTISGTNFPCANISGAGYDVCAGDGGGVGDVNDTDINVTGIFISDLISCDTINTTAEGELICGTDDGSAAGDTNETTRLNFLLASNCTGSVVAGFWDNGTAICETDDGGAGSSDGNVSSICGDNEVLLGQDTTTCIDLNTTINALENDTIYTGGTNITVSGTVISLALTSLETYLDGLYAALGSGNASFNQSFTGTLYVSRTDWTTNDNYPATCAVGEYVRAIGDTLTCVTDQTTGAGIPTMEGIYGELANHSDSGISMLIPSQNQWFQVITFEAGDSNNVTIDSTKQWLNIEVSGVYKVIWTSSFSGGLSDTYLISPFLNNDTIIGSCETHRKLGVGGDVGSATGHCLQSFSVGQNISLKFNNSDGAANAVLYSTTLTIERMLIGYNDTDTTVGNCSVSNSCSNIVYSGNTSWKVLNASFADDCASLAGSLPAVYMDDTTVGNCSVSNSCSNIFYANNETAHTVASNLTEDNVEAYIFDHDNTDNLNMSSYNITTVDCIHFDSGGKICNG